MLIQQKIYKNIFTDLFLIKYNIFMKKTDINFFIFLKFLITDKILQLYSIFFLWFLSNKNLDIKFNKIVQKNYYFVLEVKPRSYIDFLFNYFLFCNFKENSKLQSNKKLLSFSLINTTNKLSEFFLMKSFFNLNTLKTDMFFFKVNLIFIKNHNYWKENILSFFLSYFKKII